jgi:hypothetical protein
VTPRERAKRAALLAALQFLLVGLATEREPLDLSDSLRDPVAKNVGAFRRRKAHAESLVNHILAALGIPRDQLLAPGQSLLDYGVALSDWVTKTL